MHNHKPYFLAPDLAKAFGIILVVFGHCLRGLVAAGVMDETPFWTNVDKAIYLFHMPLFFFLAGLFFMDIYDRLGTAKTILRFATVLLIPMVIWSYLQTSLQLLAGDHANNRQDFYDVLSAPLPPKQQFWFLGALFLIAFIGAYLSACRNGRKIMLIISLAVTGMNLFFWNDLAKYADENPWYHLFVQTWIHLPYFYLGILLTGRKFKQLPFGPFISLWIFAASIAIYLLFPDAGGLLYVPASIICVLCVYKFMLNFEKPQPNVITGIIAFVGMNSMIIYLAHVIFSAGMRTLLLKLGIGGENFHLVAGTAAGLLLPLLLVPIGLYWARYQPALARAVMPVRIHR